MAQSRFSIYALALFVAFFTIPSPTTFPFKEFDVPPTRELIGGLKPNNYLDGTQHLLEGRIYGPECLIARNDVIYAGVNGGEVVKIVGDKVTPIFKIGAPCVHTYDEPICGRPLGLAFDTQGNNIIVADAYYGLWSVDLDTYKKTLLVSAKQPLPGKTIIRKARVFNGVAVDKKGVIYWTDSSSDYGFQDLVFASVVNPSGRLFKYERATNESQILLDEIFFANGVVLSPNEDFLVVVETGAMRLIKYHLKGTNAGQSEVFVEGLPGHPDNITPDETGIWVPLVMAVDKEHPSGFALFSNYPKVRMLLIRLLSFLEVPFRFINSFLPNSISKKAIHFIGNGESILMLAPKRTTVVRVDWEGNIVDALHGFDQSIGAISHVLHHKNYYIFGSPYNRYIGRVKAKNSIIELNQ
ncbi:adipocyte plasma membrane-associated protein-like [Teleopsis dalmanni]|uniref:adipocyte plasma membrane-associated protein-like n=1 Tax=Teleopsis dalmanni TaxID=139649 RepID=UPI0018CE345A|nr:adipocyte plasma membrane-associated protein-like [Teleopsis dalmanni]